MRRDSAAPIAGGWCRFKDCIASTSGARTRSSASWMTRQDRELAIADNLAYVAAVIDAGRRASIRAHRGWCSPDFRRASRWLSAPPSASARRIDGVIAAGGDVPPELDRDALARVPRALVCRGTRRRVVYRNDFGSRRSAPARRERRASRRWPSTAAMNGRRLSYRRQRSSSPTCDVIDDSNRNGRRRGRPRRDAVGIPLGAGPADRAARRRSCVAARRGCAASCQHGVGWKVWVAVDARRDRRSGVAADDVRRSRTRSTSVNSSPTCRTCTSMPSARGGTGTRLLEAALAWCRAQPDRPRRAVAVAAQRRRSTCATDFRTAARSWS